MKLGISTACTLAVWSILVSLPSRAAEVVRPSHDDPIEQGTYGLADTLACGNAGSCCCGCPDGDCGWNDLACSPRWSVTAEALLLQRRGPTPAVLMFNTADETQNLNASSFGFDVHPGVDLSLAYHTDADNALEVRYFGIDQWRASAGAVTTPGDLLQINAATPFFQLAGSAINADYTSELHNFEINRVRRVSPRLALLAGFRYAELDEQFQASLADATVPFTYDVWTRNRLYEFQLGGQAAIWDRGGPLTIEGVAKAGIYGNQAAHGSTFAYGGNTVPASDEASPAAFLGEIGLTASYRLGEHLSVLGGYRLLWIDGVALATDQVAASDFIHNSGIDASGDAFYHGASVGIQYMR